MSRITGRREDKKLFVLPGNRWAGKVCTSNVLRGTDTTPLSVFENIGPAIIMAGIATIIPYNKVRPMFALNWATRAVGAGCGGRKPCVTEREASIGKPI